MLGVPDAYELPAVPGLGYLKPDQSTLLRFKAAYVSGPPADADPRHAATRAATCRGILPFTISEVQALEPPRPDGRPSPCVEQPQQGEQASLLDIAVDRMEGQGPAAHQVWLPPLDVPDTLDELMPDLVEDPDARPGLAAVARRSAGWSIPLGTVDRPREQRRDTLTRRPQPARPATSPSSAARAAARARCCARSSPAWR